MAILMNQRVLTVIMIGLVMICILACDSNASNLLNGSFESPAIPINSYQFGTPSSWSWSSSTGIIFNGTVFNPVEGSNWPSPMDGEQYIDIGNVSTFSLSQTFAITSKGPYQLTWYDNAHSSGLTSPYSVSIINGSQQIVATMSFDAAHGGVWQNRVLLVTLDPGTYTVVYMATGDFQGFDTLIDHVTFVYICGDANGDGKINVGDAVFLINYVFKNGPEPNPKCAGNTNGDASVNVGDAVYLINYVFKGGPAPITNCCQ